MIEFAQHTVAETEIQFVSLFIYTNKTIDLFVNKLIISDIF